MLFEMYQFNGNDIVILINYLIISMGYYFIFKKCGVDKRWAFVPIAREYHISVCADREKEGRSYTILAAIYYILRVALELAEDNKNVFLLLSIPELGLAVAMTIYTIKINLGLTSVFGRKKIWAVFLTIFHGPSMLIFGLSKKFQPVILVDDLKKILIL